MRFTDHRIVASPTDLANFLVCRHKTALDLRVAAGLLPKPTWVDPLAAVLRQRGEDHERRYVERLRADGHSVLDLSEGSPDERLACTREALNARAADVIVQGALASDSWWGYPDILRRTDAGYEAVDTKLTRETRGGTVLQLCVYTDLLSELFWRDARALRSGHASRGRTVPFLRLRCVLPPDEGELPQVSGRRSDPGTAVNLPGTS